MLESSNRTFMELKLRWLRCLSWRSQSSNRTFMELKCISRQKANTLVGSSNRTFMELKLLSMSGVNVLPKVLIVPLWNWNIKDLALQAVIEFCSNRIFMELKYPTLQLTAQTLGSSNRTFMELKLEISRSLLINSLVLIVPLWNWNLSVEHDVECFA